MARSILTGRLEADNGTANTIENFIAGDFTSDGKILVTGSGTTLTLKSDTLEDYVDDRRQHPGRQCRDASDRRRRLELQTTTIDGGGLGTLISRAG